MFLSDVSCLHWSDHLLLYNFTGSNNRNWHNLDHLLYTKYNLWHMQTIFVAHPRSSSDVNTPCSEPHNFYSRSSRHLITAVPHHVHSLAGTECLGDLIHWWRWPHSCLTHCLDQVTRGWVAENLAEEAFRTTYGLSKVQITSENEIFRDGATDKIFLNTLKKLYTKNGACIRPVTIQLKFAIKPLHYYINLVSSAMRWQYVKGMRMETFPWYFHDISRAQGHLVSGEGSCNEHSRHVDCNNKLLPALLSQ